MPQGVGYGKDKKDNGKKKAIVGKSIAGPVKGAKKPSVAARKTLTKGVGRMGAAKKPSMAKITPDSAKTGDTYRRAGERTAVLTDSRGGKTRLKGMTVKDTGSSKGGKPNYQTRSLPDPKRVPPSARKKDGPAPNPQRKKKLPATK